MVKIRTKPEDFQVEEQAPPLDSLSRTILSSLSQFTSEEDNVGDAIPFVGDLEEKWDTSGSMGLGWVEGQKIRDDPIGHLPQRSRPEACTSGKRMGTNPSWGGTPFSDIWGP